MAEKVRQVVNEVAWLSRALKGLDVPSRDHGQFATLFGNRIEAHLKAPPVFCEGAFWFWMRGRWRNVFPETMERLLIHGRSWLLVDGRQEPAIRVDAVKQWIESLKMAFAEPSFFHESRPGVPFKNGFLHLPNHVLKPHSPWNRNRHVLDCPWVDEGSIREKTAGLRRLFDNLWACDGQEERNEKALAVLTWLGFALRGEATQQNRVLLFIGQGANGKSVLIDLLEGLFPEHAVCSVSPQALSNPVHLVELRGKALNVVGDLPTGDLRDSGPFKQVIGGDIVAARALYHGFVSFRPLAAHLYATNYLPPSVDLTEGFWRRWVCVEFNENFAKNGTPPFTKAEVLEPLLEERGAIIQLALKMAEKHKGVYVPKSSDQVKKRWRITSDSVAEFVNDEYMVHETWDDWPHPKNRAPHGMILYREYCGWCEEAHKKPVTKTNFGTRLKAIGIPFAKVGTGVAYAMTRRPRDG